MKKSLSAALAFLLASPSAGVFAADAPKISEEAPVCIPKGGNARITAKYSSGTAISSARVYFREFDEQREHYLEMRRAEGDQFWAMLPVPQPSTKQVRYRIVMKDGEGRETVTPESVVPVSSSCAVQTTNEQDKYASNLVIGQTNEGQKAVPPGFECKGVVGQILPDGDLRSVGPCKVAAIWFGIPPAAVVGIGAAVVAGGVIIITNTGGGGPPVSPSRPGLRPQQPF